MTFPANPNPNATAILIVDPASGKIPPGTLNAKGKDIGSKPTLAQLWENFGPVWAPEYRANFHAGWLPILHPDLWVGDYFSDGDHAINILAQLRDWGPSLTVVIEAGIPGVKGGGNTSALINLERVRGVIEGVARAAGCPVVSLKPHVWRKQLGIKNQPKTKTRPGVKAEKQMADMCKARSLVKGPLQEWYSKAFKWPRADGPAPKSDDRRACLLMGVAVCDAWGLDLGGGV